jgi:23S rRNA (uracil1939-C5)-methyltransferase
VPRAAPGDVVRAEIDGAHRPARGRLIELVTPGADRVTPLCPWSVRCGGCDWMHVSLEAQRNAHVDHVRAALPAVWRQATRPVTIESHPAPQAIAYRTRARVHVRSERGRLRVGMHEARSHDPVEVESCAVLDPTLEGLRRSLGLLLEGSRGRGDALIALGVGRRPVLDLHWRGDVAAVCFARLERAVGDGELAGACITVGAASRPAVVGRPEPWTMAADGEPLRLGAGGFAQANERVNALLARHVADLARRSGADKAVELYGGAGNLGVLLAREVRELVVVEASRPACDAARANFAARGLDVRVVEADADAYVFGPATQLAVLDPPRTGARALATRLAASRMRHVIYVSCDTPTLGRDLEVLARAYEIGSVHTFEMFPQTSHVETVVALERRRGKVAEGSPSVPS